MRNRIAAAIAIVTTIAAIGAWLWLVPSFAPNVEAAKLGNQAKFEQGISVGRGGTEIDSIHGGATAFSSGVAVITASWVTDTTRIIPARGTVSGTSGVGIAVTRTAGTSFTLTSQTAGALTTQTSDNSAVVWIAFDQPTPYPTATATATYTPTPTP